MQVVIETAKESFSQVHVTNGVDWLLEGNTSWQLTVSEAPVMLDTLQMPLIHEDYNLFALWLVDVFEEILVSLVDEDFLNLGEENFTALNVPVNQVLI